MVTDGFAAFDKIRRCVDNCSLPLRLFSSANALLFHVGVTLCLPSGSGATRVTLLQATACCHQLHSWNSWGCPGMEGCLTGPRSLTTQSLAQEAGFSWHTLKYIYLLWLRGTLLPLCLICPGDWAVGEKERECLCTHKSHFLRDTFPPIQTGLIEFSWSQRSCFGWLLWV